MIPPAVTLTAFVLLIAALIFLYLRINFRQMHPIVRVLVTALYAWALWPLLTSAYEQLLKVL